MSTSNLSNLVGLEVRTADAATEIFVIDGHFHLVDRGLGSMKTFLRPGIYKVKVRAGFETREEHVILREGDKEVVKEFPVLRFSSSAPLNDTAKTHEFHIAAANEESGKIHVRAGQGSWIFVFVRDWTARKQPAITSQGYLNPARGLTLRDARGNAVADFTTQSKSELTWDSWAACNVQVDPGLYQLSLETPLGTRLEQTIVATSDWQTQVFLLQRAYGAKPNDRRADLSGASILLSRDHSFNPYSPDMRLVELARLGLANERRVLSQDMRKMLQGKFENPMLGVYGAHLLLLDKEPDFKLLDIVVTNLRSLLGTHPDVEALALPLEANSGSYVFDVPPMLRRSWSLIVNATVTRPNLVPLNSLAASIADRLWGEEPWLLWMSPVKEQPAHLEGSTPEIEGGPELSELEAALKAHLPSANQPNESSTQLGELNLVATPATVHDAAASIPRPQLDENAVKRLVQTLGIPRANLEDLLSRVHSKSLFEKVRQQPVDAPSNES